MSLHTRYPTSFQVFNVIALLAVIATHVVMGVTVSLHHQVLTHPVLWLGASITYWVYWPVLALSLLVFVGFQCRRDQRRNPALVRISPAFWAVCAAHCAFTILYQQQAWLWCSALSILGLAALVFAFLQLAYARDDATSSEYWCITLPISLSCAWAIHACVSTLAISLLAYHANAWTLTTMQWAFASFLFTTAIATVLLLKHPEPAFGFAIVWQLFGLAIHDTYLSAPIAETASALMVYFAILCFLGATRSQAPT